jgi:hypothetical protein
MSAGECCSSGSGTELARRPPLIHSSYTALPNDTLYNGY